jgi:hypothetical protein
LFPPKSNTTTSLFELVELYIAPNAAVKVAGVGEPHTESAKSTVATLATLETA